MDKFREKYKNIFKSICRVCLTYESANKMFCLVDEQSEDGLSCYGKSLLAFAKIPIVNNDDFPNMLCHNCLLLLKQSICFKLKCESTQDKLKRLMEKSIICNESLTKNIVEYAMFVHYFSTRPSETQRIPETQKDQANINDISSESKVFIRDGETAKRELIGEADWINNPMFNDEEYCKLGFSKIFKTDMDNLNIKKIKLETDSNVNLKKSQNGSNMFDKTKKIKIEPTERVPAKKTQDFTCKLCNKVLANKKTYECHMQRHTGCKYVCEHCGKGFTTNPDLNTHKVALHGTGVYLKCRHCDYKAPRRFLIVEHERTHTGERPFSCDKCGRTFRRRYIWKKHLLYHEEKKVQCNSCPRKFYTRSEMLAHSNNVHERVYVYSCPNCGISYAKRESVRRHLAEKHGVPKKMQGKLIRTPYIEGKSNTVVE